MILRLSSGLPKINCVSKMRGIRKLFCSSKKRSMAIFRETIRLLGWNGSWEIPEIRSCREILKLRVSKRLVKRWKIKIKTCSGSWTTNTLLKLSPTPPN